MIEEIQSVEGRDDLRRRVLWAVPNALAVLGTINDDGSAHFMTVSWLTPVSNEPTRVAVSVEGSSRSAHNLAARAVASISLIDDAHRELVRRFVKPELEHEQRDGVEYVAGYAAVREGESAPALADALAVLIGSCEHVRELGDHQLWLLSVSHVAADPSVLEGPASAHIARALSVQDTRFNYGR